MRKELDLPFYHAVIEAIVVSVKWQKHSKGVLALAFENPSALYDENGDWKLAERGLTLAEHQHLTAKFALVDTVIAQKQMAEIDWKEDEGEVRFAINAVLQAKGLTQILLQERYENEDTFAMLRLIDDRELNPNKLCLEILDIDSDSYVFTIVPLEMRTVVAEMFAQLK